MNQPGWSDRGLGDGESRTSSCATELVCPDCDFRAELSEAAFRCPSCGTGLDVAYDYELAAARVAALALAERPLARPLNLWRLEELMPIVDRVAADRVGQFSGNTPLIR